MNVILITNKDEFTGELNSFDANFRRGRISELGSMTSSAD